jgi:hypothetical protein
MVEMDPKFHVLSPHSSSSFAGPEGNYFQQSMHPPLLTAQVHRNVKYSLNTLTLLYQSSSLLLLWALHNFSRRCCNFAKIACMLYTSKSPFSMFRTHKDSSYCVTVGFESKKSKLFQTVQKVPKCPKSSKMSQNVQKVPICPKSSKMSKKVRTDQTVQNCPKLRKLSKKVKKV